MRRSTTTHLGIALVATGLTSIACHEAARPSQPSAATPPQAPTVTPPGAAGAQSKSAAPKPQAVNHGQCPRQGMLDDLEDGNSAIIAAEQRNGFWMTYTDEIGSSIAPAAREEFRIGSPGSEGSKHAVHVKGKTAPHGNVYAGVGFWFTQEKLPYDASCCKGISFRAKRAKGSLDSVRLKVGDTNTLPEGQVCTKCYNDFGVDLGFGEEWKLYRIPFENMRQSPNWGEQYPSITPHGLLQLQWQVSHPGFDFEFWIDDVALSDCVPPA